jgi:hypothetical protein
MAMPGFNAAASLTPRGDTFAARWATPHPRSSAVRLAAWPPPLGATPTPDYGAFGPWQPPAFWKPCDCYDWCIGQGIEAHRCNMLYSMANCLKAPSNSWEHCSIAAYNNVWKTPLC